MSASIRRLLITLLALALLAAACGGSDDADEPATGDEPSTTETGDDGDTDADEDASGDDAETDATDDGDESEAGDEPAPVAEVQRGGSISVLIEAETDTWNMPVAQCAASCQMVMFNVADTLFIVNDAGETEPFLLESYTVNDDATVHTLTMRDGVTFHDGTPADGAALQRNLSEMASGLLQGQLFVDLADGVNSIVLIDDMTVEVTYARPFATFARVMADRTGMLYAPSYWDDPDRAAALPIATGPFQMTEWVRGERTVVTANPTYWRTDADGEALPYVDEIVFRPIPDGGTRRTTMEADDGDVSHSSLPDEQAFWREQWGGGVVEPSAAREINFLLFNLSLPPFDDPDLRRALALCTDRDEYMAFRAPGGELAQGPFASGATGHDPDPGFPGFDPDAGNALLDEIGRPDVIRYGTTNVTSNLLTAEFFADMWSTNCGLTIDIDQFDQSELVTRVLTANYEVMLWRNHGRPSPALETPFMHSRHSTGLATNFSRVNDPELDQLLFDAMATSDLGELDAIGQQITGLFADNVYALWLNVADWSIAHNSRVSGVGTLSTPGGSVAQPSSFGWTWLSEAWISS